MMRLTLALLLATLTACSSSPNPSTPDVAYASGSDAHRLNLYVPPGTGPFPVVVMVHGGAFLFGDHGDAGPGFAEDVRTLNDAGIAVASVGYRLSGEATFPAAVRDVKAAVRFLRRTAASHRLDPARIALWGKSAGANLALMAGLTHGRPMFDDPALADPAIDDRVSAIVAFYPPVDFGTMDRQLAARGCKVGSGPFSGPHDAADSPESRYLGAPLARVPGRVALSNPANHVGPGAPPVLLAAGTADCTVPPDQSRLMLDALRARSPKTPSELIMVDGAEHADPALDEGATLARVRAFLVRHLRPA